jgi:hypothetical protein
MTMGNNNYQFQLQSLEILDEYIRELTKEKEYFMTFQHRIVGIHSKYEADNTWNDRKHTLFKDTHIDTIQKACEDLRLKIGEAEDFLRQLKTMYANAGVV